MDEIIARCVAGEADELELHKLKRWRARSPANDDIHRKTSRLWDLLEAEAGSTVGPPPPLTRVVEEAERRRRASARQSARKSGPRRPRLVYGLGAAVAAVLATLWVGARVSERGGELFLLDSTTGRARIVTMTFSDGTVVRTAPETRLELHPSPEAREVRLDGRAFFAVAGGTVPFVVHTGLGDLHVTGTRFEVATDAEQVRVVVVEGKVVVGEGAAAVEVGVGQVAYLSPGGGARVVSLDDPWSLLDWEGGLLVFQSTPLRDVAAEMGRHFSVTTLVDDEVAARRVTAWFEDQRREEVVSAVCLISGTSCRISGDTVFIGP